MTFYPLTALRALALHTQKLDTPNGSEPAPSLDCVYETVDQLGGVQIDTLQRVARAHYLAIWSRHGTYPISLLDDLFARERKLFEGWYHAACYLPTHEYRYQMPRQRKAREDGHSWYARWITEPGHREMVEAVIERIRAEGGLRVSDFENPAARRGSWWDWKPAKVALEYAFSYGILMIDRREKFQRVYDLTGRVLPAHVDTDEPSAAERDRFFVERGARAIGVGLPRNPGDYTWMKITVSRPIVKDLLKSGILVEIQGETLNGPQALVIYRDNLPLLEKAASGEIRPQRTTFLIPGIISGGRRIVTRRCGVSGTPSKRMCPAPSASTVTIPCRFCTKTGWWGVLTPNWSVKPACCVWRRFILNPASSRMTC